MKYEAKSSPNYSAGKSLGRDNKSRQKFGANRVRVYKPVPDLHSGMYARICDRVAIRNYLPTTNWNCPFWLIRQLFRGKNVWRSRDSSNPGALKTFRIPDSGTGSLKRQIVWERTTRAIRFVGIMKCKLLEVVLRCYKNVFLFDFQGRWSGSSASTRKTRRWSGTSDPITIKSYILYNSASTRKWASLLGR